MRDSLDVSLWAWHCCNAPWPPDRDHLPYFFSFFNFGKSLEEKNSSAPELESLSGTGPLLLVSWRIRTVLHFQSLSDCKENEASLIACWRRCSYLRLIRCFQRRDSWGDFLFPFGDTVKTLTAGCARHKHTQTCTCVRARASGRPALFSEWIEARWQEAALCRSGQIVLPIRRKKQKEKRGSDLLLLCCSPRQERETDFIGSAVGGRLWLTLAKELGVRLFVLHPLLHI